MRCITAFSAIVASACLLANAPAAAQEDTDQPSVAEMEQALGLVAGPAGRKGEGARFRSPTFELTAPETGGGESAPSPSGSETGARGFSVPIEFAFGSNKVAATYQPTIDNLVAVLRRNPGLTLTIRGHTDAVGSEDSNALLSRQRAETVRSALVARGVAPERLSAEGVGETMLIARISPNSPRNRRVEFLRRQ